MMGENRPKHVQPTWNNKLIYIVHLVGYFYSRIAMLHGFMNVNYTNLNQTTPKYTKLQQTTPTHLQRQLVRYYTSSRIKNFRHTFVKLEQSGKSSNMQTHQSLTNKCLQNSGAEHDALDGHNRRLRYVIEIIRSNHNEINWGFINPLTPN